MFFLGAAQCKFLHLVFHPSNLFKKFMKNSEVPVLSSSCLLVVSIGDNSISSYIIICFNNVISSKSVPPVGLEPTHYYYFIPDPKSGVSTYSTKEALS